MKKFIERLFTAVTFAEANCHKEAIEIFENSCKRISSLNSFLKDVGLAGTRVQCGVVRVRNEAI